MLDDPTNVLRQDTKYVFDAAEADLVVPLINSAFAESSGYLDANQAIRARIAELLGRTINELDIDAGGEDAPASKDQVEPAPIQEPIRHELDRAFHYELIVPFDGPVTCEIGHAENEREFVWPPRIEYVTDEVVALWAYLADKVSAPGAAARFHDLVFTRGRDRFAHGTAARDAYLAYAALAAVVDLDQAHALLRAWAIDRILGRAEEVQEAREAFSRAISTAWDAGENAAGVLLPMLGALCVTQLPPDQDPVQVDALLERASEIYGPTDQVGYVANLRRVRARSEDERVAINTWHVDQLAAVARASEGFVKSMRLADAIREAGRFQLRELEAQLTVELQSLPPADSKLETVSTESRVSRVPLERFYRQFTRSRDWRRGLGLLNKMPPPTGSVEELVQAAEERRLRPRLIDIFTTVLLDEDRLPSWQPTTDAEQAEYRIARDAGINAAVAGSHLAEILDRLNHKYGHIPVDDLAAFVSHEGRGNYELSAVFARAVHHYWNGDLEACVHIAVPRIESAARLILRELDVAIYRIQLGRRPGLYPQLGSLLDEFEGLGFDADWVFYLRWLLTEHTGKNLRNQVAHGRVRGVTPSDAALVLRALLLLVLLAGPGNADDIDNELADSPPTDLPRRRSKDLRPIVDRPIPGGVPYPALPLVIANRLLRRAGGLRERLLRRQRR